MTGDRSRSSPRGRSRPCRHHAVSGLSRRLPGVTVQEETQRWETGTALPAAALNGPLHHAHPGNDRQTIDQGYGPEDPSHDGHPASGAGVAVADRALSEEEL
jgi:hypothetical protein